MMMIIIIQLLILAFFFGSIFNPRRNKRIPPVNSSKFIVSPIDGYISDIQTVNIDNVLFVEISIYFSWTSDRYLFAPVKGDINIKDESLDKVSISINGGKSSAIEINKKNYIEIAHYPHQFLSKLNFFSSKFVDLYEKESWKSGLNYGVMLRGSHVKILIHASNEILVSEDQTLIGGESILAIINKDEVF